MASKDEIKKNSVVLRDYSKPMVLELRGEKGLRAYIEIANSPHLKYDAKAASKRAAENLKKQGLVVTASSRT